MSKRNSLTPSNTLFNYFAKSPASKIKPSTSNGVEKSSPNVPTPAAKIPKIEQESPKANKKASKRKIELNDSAAEEKDSDQDEEIIGNTKKRHRIFMMDSDSDEENSSDNANQKKKKKSSKSEKEKSLPNVSFQDKLKNFKSEPSDSNDSGIDVPETKVLDEPIIWRHNTLEFLQPDNIRDKNKRKPSHPDYDPRTLYVPESFLKDLSPGVRQWWDLKSDYFDCVLLFKVGKFYELYHMDADVGVKELGFTYMRGEFAHAGFPEQAYDRMATSLVDKGYKVARVEQTETPEMMTQRCKSQLKVTKFDRVVKREICQVINRGTKVYGAQCQITLNYEPNYMLAIIEKEEGIFSTYGICYIDTSIGDFYIGQFKDDNNCSRLLTLLSHNPPVLVLYEKRGISSRTEQIFKSVLGNVLKESLANDTQFWSGEKVLKHLAENYFSKEGESVEWPKVIKIMQDDSDHLGLTPNESFKFGLKALGGCIWYLKRSVIDQQVLDMARYHIYTPPDMFKDFKKTIDLTEEVKARVDKSQTKPSMVLDSITLTNLRITGEECSLLSTLDYCCTKFGKRLLHHWVCAPSCDVNVIRERQSAISDFLANSDMFQEVRALFNKLPDFERHLAQMHGFGNGKRLKNHPDGRAILFEEKNYNKRKIQNFISILHGFESLLNIPKLFQNFKSDLIRRLTQPDPEGIFPDMKKVLEYFKTSFDHEEALKEGIIAPEKGVDTEFDSIEEEIANINKELEEYRREQERYFGCKITYFGNDKKRFQLEIPEAQARKAGSEYYFEGQRKGSKPVRRFHTDETKEFYKRISTVEDQRSNVLKDLLRRIFEKFSNHYEMWKRCVDSVAILDVLGSLAEYARNQNEICIPEVVDDADASFPFIELEEGYHPCITTNYIPNGIKLGGSDVPPLALLTGPNMGGKSTLMRQAGLLCIMTQVGAHIPAQSCRMSVIDRIFTRLGAQDNILAGQSTFLVELSETSAIMKHSTVNSLVLVDELGRGTATYDGTAIAASVLHYLADQKCRSIFSTHYHNLVDFFEKDPRISLGHMACMVENEDNEDPTQETVTFLYKYTSGACPKSYGFNAAKLAGMPHSIIKRACELSKKVEAEALQRQIISKIMQKDNLSQIKNLLFKLQSCKMK